MQIPDVRDRSPIAHFLWILIDAVGGARSEPSLPKSTIWPLARCGSRRAALGKTQGRTLQPAKASPRAWPQGWMTAARAAAGTELDRVRVFGHLGRQVLWFL
jgi:hypothetical protein